MSEIQTRYRMVQSWGRQPLNHPDDSDDVTFKLGFYM